MCLADDEIPVRVWVMPCHAMPQTVSLRMDLVVIMFKALKMIQWASERKKKKREKKKRKKKERKERKSEREGDGKNEEELCN